MSNDCEKECCEAAETVEDRTRTVLDFSSDFELREALSEALDGKKDLFTAANSDGDSTSEKKVSSVLVGCLGPVDTTDERSAAASAHDTAFDWVLTNYDESTTEAQSMEEELQRLLVLKSYLILDAEREEAFERLTALGGRIFNVPICLVSLIDIGRQWFMSNMGLGLCRQTNRRVAFCAHAIQLKPGLKTLVVRDARTDFRFQDSPLVLGPPFIRFYAGAPLISPEGFKLGTFCIISPEPRPQGLSTDEQESLIDMAYLTVKTMVDRRAHLESREDPARLIAYTSHDLMTPLSGVQLSLSLLSEDEDVLSKLDSHQNELLSTATNCSDIMIRICKSSIDSLRTMATGSKRSLYGKDSGNRKVTEMVALMKSLQVIVEPIPKQVPLAITLSPDVPNRFVSDDLKIFRSALNLVKDAILRTEIGKVHLRIFRQERENDKLSDGVEQATYLTFECEDSGLDIPKGEVPFLFELSNETPPARLGLHSIANLIKSLSGTFGYRKRGENISGSVFWFSVPLILADTSDDDSVQSFCFSVHSVANGLHFQRRGSTNPVDTSSFSRKMSNSSLTSLSSEGGDIGRIKRALIIDDSIIVRKTIVRALTKLGFEVEQAENGLEGLNSMKHTMFDIVLCDFLMPVMDGLDCVKQYREWENEERQYFRQYIVGISAHVGVEESVQGLEAGMNAFRPKPISMKNLTDLQSSEPAQRISKQLDNMIEVSSSCRPPREVASSCNIDGSPFPRLSANISPVEKVRKETSRDLETRETTRYSLVLSGERSQCFENMNADGWQLVFSESVADLECQLRKRNWELVLIDEEVPFLSVSRLITSFREWEASNRVNEQKNIFLVSSSDIPRPGDKYSIVRPPSGFNGVLQKPIVLQDIDHLLKRNKNSLNILVPKKTENKC